MCFCSRGSLQKSLEVEDLGPKRIAALEKEAEEWRMKAEDAVASIQDITVTYFAQTSKALAGMSRQDHYAVLSPSPVISGSLCWSHAATGCFAGCCVRTCRCSILPLSTVLMEEAILEMKKVETTGSIL